MCSVKASYSIKPWMWNLVTVPAWSDLILVTLWRNDGFLHLFCNFSKSNVFDENFMRTKFILHKIFFQMSILSSSKTSWMFSNLRWKNCEKSLVGGHDHFEGKGASGDKNQYKLFCKKWGFEYFLHSNFFKKTIFSKITAKNNIWGGGRPFFRKWSVGRQKWI